MADTKYSYSLSADFPNGAVDPEVLGEEIGDSSISSASYLYTAVAGDDCDIWFDDPLSGADETTLDGVVAAHLGVRTATPIKGGLILRPMDTPAAPTVSVQGTTGSTTWAYKVTAISQSGETMPSSATQVTNGNATLSSSNFNRVSWTTLQDAIGYKVYRSTAGGTPSSTGKIKEVPPTVLSIDDTGITASGAEPSEDRSGTVIVGDNVNGTGAKVLDLKELTTDDSTVTSLFSMLRRSSGTVEAGFGTGLYVRLNDDSDVVREVAGLHMLWSDPGVALESAFRVNLRDGGTGIVERFKFHHDGSIDIKSNTVIDEGECQDPISVTGVHFGYEVTVSSNNSVVALRFPYDGANNGYARWNIRPPQKYTSGNLTFRLLVSVPSTIGNDKDTKWTLRWSKIGTGESLGSWDHSTTQTIDVSNQTLDQLFALDFPILSSQFDKTDELMPMRVERLCTDSDDDCNVHIYVHDMRLVYTGNRFGGQ